jgi:hypothetical protein
VNNLDYSEGKEFKNNLFGTGFFSQAAFAVHFRKLEVVFQRWDGSVYTIWAKKGTF